MKLIDRIDLKEYEWIVDILNKLTFVEWDRYIWWNVKKPNMVVFGWIERSKDDYKDFVVLEFNTTEQAVYFVSTSSAEYSKKIAHILGSNHKQCNKVQDAFETVRCCE